MHWSHLHQLYSTSLGYYHFQPHNLVITYMLTQYLSKSEIFIVEYFSDILFSLFSVADFAVSLSELCHNLMMIKSSSWYHNLEENRQLICPRSKLAWLIKTFPGIYYSVMTAIRARTLPSLSPFSLYTSENNKEVSKTYLCQLKGPLKVSTRKIEIHCNKGQ